MSNNPNMVALLWLHFLHTKPSLHKILLAIRIRIKGLSELYQVQSRKFHS